MTLPSGIPACRAMDLGLVPYAAAFTTQKREVERLQRGEGDDVLLYVQHPHVITVGRNATASAILADRRLIASRGCEIVTTDRGGDVTYHGPGQLVGYPILRLEGSRRDIRRYVYDLEGVLIAALADFGVFADRHPVHRGVWVQNRKIASLGIRISRWVTCHGFALNVSTDLSFFSLMNPCGIAGCTMTSLEREMLSPVSMNAVRESVTRHFGPIMGRHMQEESIVHVH
ncbi:MAG: lipoyl(octanoyl) transferase LipB [Candidatus Krumholzibacteria bacterium]|nr:lipoyl(octanoyl) transferase LipB [Candidatus Krumholzibacteria bacterium]MDH4337079.1 lipoyl(octanoyl) transferase LipB [Candidatus Krumholzibacteria bacterium]MDH5268616.1 lipoyl(octanoyl) transferase LipB [Candidatus Krumholzibacteria bacterium]MDH5627931.1 lipoyl(octanoyl) transferase LipB [Candidatus Krumholzibacteria bacterium]